MKAIILLATLKKNEKSNTEVLCDFLINKLENKKVSCELIKLADHYIPFGTYHDMGGGDEWPSILKKLQKADIIIFATPIWWGVHSSLMQVAIERLDEIHDEIEKGKKSRLEGKVGGIVITGDSDGAEHTIGNIANFWNGIGIVLPPYVTLAVLSEKHLKSKPKSQSELLKLYKKEYTKTANTMVENLIKYAK